MTETETLIAEVRQLRADVARLHAAHTPVHIRPSRPVVSRSDVSDLGPSPLWIFGSQAGSHPVWVNVLCFATSVFPPPLDLKRLRFALLLV